MLTNNYHNKQCYDIFNWFNITIDCLGFIRKFITSNIRYFFEQKKKNTSESIKLMIDKISLMLDDRLGATPPAMLS